jgi:1,4-dihydroxy-2-naphthoate octaprenyltransferase
MVLTGTLGFGSLVVLGGLPMLLQALDVYSKPKPSSPPPGYPVWPLWYVSAAFVHTRRAGALFVLGLFLNWIFRL